MRNNMTGLDIVILIIGGLLILVSCFLVERKKSEEPKLAEETTKRQLQESLQQFELQAQAALEEAASACTDETKEELNRLTNEKIIAVSEFGEQLLAKLENSHQEVVFLYDMMMNKEEEMKSTLNRMEVLRKENQAFIEKIMELRDAKIKAMGKTETGKPKTKAKAIAEQKKQEQKPVVQTSHTEPAAEKKQNNYEEELPENIKRQILELHQKKLSVKEISRRLSVGQGEVKLIIDLYG